MARRQTTNSANAITVQTQGDLHRVTLKPRKITRASNLIAIPLRIAGFLFGLFYFLVALVFCVTIVGLVIGIPMGVAAAGVIVMALNSSKQRVVCPSCSGKRNFVSNRAEAFVCSRCKSNVLVDWS